MFWLVNWKIYQISRLTKICPASKHKNNDFRDWYLVGFKITERSGLTKEMTDFSVKWTKFA